MVSKIIKKTEKSVLENIAIKNLVAKFKKTPLYFGEFLINFASIFNPQIQKDKEELLNNQQISLLSFVMDCQTSKFRKWHIFKEEMALLRGIEFNGRAIPQKKSKGPSIGEMDRMGKFYKNKDEKVEYFTTLPLWKCKTVVDKIKLIAESDAPSEIKVEFLADLV